MVTLQLGEKGQSVGCTAPLPNRQIAEGQRTSARLLPNFSPQASTPGDLEPDWRRLRRAFQRTSRAIPTSSFQRQRQIAHRLIEIS
jgi:hypothetical protein